MFHLLGDVNRLRLLAKPVCAQDLAERFNLIPSLGESPSAFTQSRPSDAA